MYQLRACGQAQSRVNPILLGLTPFPSQELWPLLRDGGHVYVCGDAARLAPAVKAALKAVVATAGGLGDAKAAAFVDQLCAVGPSQRYHEDVWAANA